MEEQNYWGSVKNSDAQEIMEFWKNTESLSDTERIQEIKRYCELKKHYIPDVFDIVLSFEEVINGKSKWESDNVYKLVRNETLLREQPTTKQQHFNLTKSDAHILHSRLKDAGYIDKETSESRFAYWLSGGNKPDGLKPIEWIKQQDRLACMIDQLFGGAGFPHWNYTSQAFRVMGKTPNIKTMKSDANKIKEGIKNGDNYKEISNITKDLNRRK